MEAKDTMMEKQKVLYWSHTTQPFHADIGAEMVAEFNASQDEVEVFAVGTAYGDTKSKLPTVVAAGSAPDISFLDRYITKSARRSRRDYGHHAVREGFRRDAARRHLGAHPE